MDDTLEVQTPSGRIVQIWVAPSGLNNGRVELQAALPSMNIARQGCSGPALLPSPQSGATHVIRIGLKVQVGLSAAEAKRIEDLLAAHQAVLDASPEGQMRKLRSEREAIVLQMAGNEAAANAARNRAWERGDEEGAFTAKPGDSLAATARLRLQAFDQDHPEVLAAILAERALKTEQQIAWAMNA